MNEQQPILIHAYSGPLGGSERILLDLLRRMDRPAVLACPPGHLADSAEGDGITVVRVKERPLAARGSVAAATATQHLLGHGREIRILAKNLDPALIVSWGMRSAMAATTSLRRQGCPLVAEHVDLLPDGPQGHAARKALLRFDRVVCLSYSIAEDLDSAWHASGRISVVHPGVELQDGSDPRRRDLPTALMLAAIEPWKGQHTALEAVAKAPGIRLVLAGSPIGGGETEYLRELKRRAQLPDLAGRVEFPGWIDGTTALADSTVLIHTAPAEPFGRALIDAMAAGRPVIALNTAGPREIVTPDCGRLVPLDSPSQLASALTEICGDPTLAAAMGAAGRRRVAADFDAVHQSAKWQRAALSLAPLPAGSK
ncbi:MAG: glycosyltransferase family 4 protein, partial [Actinomycetes bacterium]